MKASIIPSKAAQELAVRAEPDQYGVHCSVLGRNTVLILEEDLDTTTVYWPYSSAAAHLSTMLRIAVTDALTRRLAHPVGPRTRQ